MAAKHTILLSFCLSFYMTFTYVIITNKRQTDVRILHNATFLRYTKLAKNSIPPYRPLNNIHNFKVKIPSINAFAPNNRNTHINYNHLILNL